MDIYRRVYTWQWTIVSLNFSARFVLLEYERMWTDVDQYVHEENRFEELNKFYYKLKWFVSY